MIRLVDASTENELPTLKKLFREYETWLDFDLCFQDFEKEMSGLPGDYAPPGGRLLVAYEGAQAAGCVALRPMSESACEMKRLYVSPQFRGRSIGRLLAEEVIRQARQIGYKFMRLDTVDWMKEAIALYRSLGFREIDPYRYNPIEGAMYLELRLDQPPP